MASLDKYNSSDDMFADTRMSFGEHLEDLRLHLWRAIAGFLVALFFSFFIGKPVLQIIAAPVEEQLGRFFVKRTLKVQEALAQKDAAMLSLNAPKEVQMSFKREQLGQLFAQMFGLPLKMAADDEEWIELTVRIHPLDQAIATQEAQMLIGRRPGLSTLSVQEAFMAYFKVCVACGFVFGSPWIFYQLWLFVAAGLYPHEKKYVHVYLPFSLGLFLIGVLVCQFLVIPKAIEALLWFNQWIGLEPDIRFNEWLGFAILMPLVFGLSFQLPLVMMFLERVGLFSVESYISRWRIAFFIIQVFAALITPSVDFISMQLLAIPMFGLYGLGIFLCRLNPRRRDLDMDVPDSEEMVEV